MIILGLSKWSFQWITNFVNYIINIQSIQSYQNTNKITFHSNCLLFVCFSIALECCKFTRIFHRATFWWYCAVAQLGGSIADDAMQMDVHKTLYPFYLQRKCPMLR